MTGEVHNPSFAHRTLNRVNNLGTFDMLVLYNYPYENKLSHIKLRLHLKQEFLK